VQLEQLAQQAQLDSQLLLKAHTTITHCLLLELEHHLETLVTVGLSLQKILCSCTLHLKDGLTRKQLSDQQGQRAHAVQLVQQVQQELQVLLDQQALLAQRVRLALPHR
jgi:hypothetical protein